MIASLRASILRGDATATSLAAAAVAAARASPWNDFVRVDEARAAATSRRLDGGARQDAPLFGVPFAAKANLCVAGETPTAGSAAVGGWVARADATAVARLAAAGAVLVGSTNCDEFGMGSTGEASAHGATLNPRDAAASPGGSSGGSAAAVAAGSVPFALGSDTGGSVRLPASWCGVVGLKPSYGRVSRHGLLAYCSSTDCVGVLATSVGDAAAVLRVIAGADGLDATCVDAPVEDYAGLLAAPANFRVAAVAEASDLADADAAAAAAAAAAALGADVVSLPWLRDACAAYYVLSASEAFGNLSRYAHVGRPRTAEAWRRVDHASAPFGAEVLRRLRLGAHFLGDRHADGLYGRAEAVRDAVRRDLAALFRDYDALVLPVAPTAAPAAGAARGAPSRAPRPPAGSLLAAVEGDLPDGWAHDQLTCFASLAGAPALSLPFGTSRAGLPVGVQVVARPLGDATALRVAKALEDARRGG